MCYISRDYVHTYYFCQAVVTLVYMSKSKNQSWLGVQEEVLRRIRDREWQPGEQIPNEADLALELNCARTTVNRALRSIADSGLIQRRRKAGTFVALNPVQVLNVSQLRMIFAILGAGLAIALAIFALELTVKF